MLMGPSGSGKSIFGLQYLYSGAKKHYEPGFLVQIEGYESDLSLYQERFGWDFTSLISQEKIVFSSFDPVDFEKFEPRSLRSGIFIQLNKILDQIKAKRVVFDSVTPIGLSFKDESKFRTMLYYISRFLKEKGCTTVFISETNESLKQFFDVEPFVMDGVLEIKPYMEKGQRMFKLQVEKMLATDVPREEYLYDITDRGVMMMPPHF